MKNFNVMKRILVMLCAVVLVLNANAQEVSATYDPDVDGDNNIGVTDLLALLSLFSENDFDDDGIWDSQDDCVGEYDECGVCNGPGPQILGIDTIIVYYDSLYAEAIDEWWVFEVDADTLLTYLCENPGCMDPTADNYDPYAIEEDNSCFWTEGSPVCDFQNTYTFDGYTYDLVAIGNQCWFAENLRTEHYANGDAIPGELNASEWSNTTSGAVSVYGEGTSTVYDGSDDEESNLADYGRLYNWYAVDDERGLCPSGWHVPTDAEWTTLTNGLGEFAGDALKSAASDSPAWDGTNTSGFSGLPGGSRGESGGFHNAGGDGDGFWWSSLPSLQFPYFRALRSDQPGVSRSQSDGQRDGFSVRCLKDPE